MGKKDLKVGVYMRVGNKSQLGNMGEKIQRDMAENEMKGNLALLQIYQLEDNFKNKLNALESKIPVNKVKAIIYTNDENYRDGKSKRLDEIRKFCKKYKKR